MSKSLKDLTKAELIEQLERVTTDFEATVDYMNEGCICGRAPNPQHPVDPRLLGRAPAPAPMPVTAKAQAEAAAEKQSATGKTATILRSSSELAMQLSGVKRDKLGRVVSGFVENGGWHLSADHGERVFWSDNYPDRKTSMADFKGWDE